MTRDLSRITVPLATFLALALHPQPATAQKRPADGLLPTRTAEIVYTSTVTGLAVSNALLHFRPGTPTLPGRSPDERWTTPDKGLHLGTSYLLAITGMRAGARPWVAAAGICGAGTVFETTQSYFSSRDAAVNCAGGGAAWATMALLRRVKGKQAARAARAAQRLGARRPAATLAVRDLP